MISSFAAYLLLVSVLLAGGARATEQSFIARRWPRRFLWLATLLASVLFPLGMALSTAPVHTVVRTKPPAQLEVFALSPTEKIQTHGPQSVQTRPAASLAAPAAPRSPAGRNPGRASLDVNLLVSVVWLLSSIVTALWYLLAGIRLARLVRRAPCATVQGVPVRMAPAGPAVFGLFRPAILWPPWLDEAPATTRAAAIAHETQHLAARDPLVLAAGLFLVVVAPWNPALWWQLRRMRFAMEADCDLRVVRGGTDEHAYARALLQIAQARMVGGAGLAVLMSAPSWLERRVGTLLHAPGRRGVLLAAVGLPFALGAWVAVAQLPAPSLHGAELRKLPPEDMRPGADWARAIARSRYPELFDRHFDGTAVVAAIFKRDGTLKLVDKHEFAPGVPPSGFEMRIDNQRAGVGLDDILYGAMENGWPSTCRCTIGPWLDTVNPGRVFVVYEVLKWEPDPRRSLHRAVAAFQAAEPRLFDPSAQLDPSVRPPRQFTLLMNDDGTIGRMSNHTAPEGEDEAYQNEDPFTNQNSAAGSFAAMGVPQERLGRAVWFRIGDSEVLAAWAKRGDDPPDVWDLNSLEPSLEDLRANPPREDVDDEERLGRRYFHDLQMHGPEAITEVVAGEKTLRMPWVLLGLDGQVWDAGLWHSISERPVMTDALVNEIMARYPAIELDSESMPISWHPDWYISGVPIVTLRIAANSPIQRKSDVDLQKRKDILVTGGLAEECVIEEHLPRLWGNPWPAQALCASQLSPRIKGVRKTGFVPFVMATDLGVPAIINMQEARSLFFDVRGFNSVTGQGIGQSISPDALPSSAAPFEVTVTQTGEKRTRMKVRRLTAGATADAASPASQTVQIEAPYGQAVTVEIPGDAANRTMRLLLRAERLKQ